MAEEMKTKPDRCVADLGVVMSNHDHEIRPGMEEKLRGDPTAFGEHTAWEFYGEIWFEDGEFHEMVRRYTRHVATHSATTLAALQKIVNDEHGWA